MKDDNTDRTELPNFEEEFANEISPYLPELYPPTFNMSDLFSTGNTLGYIGVILSLLSLFQLPYLLGPLGIILGASAAAEDAKGLGVTGILLGIVGIVFHFAMSMGWI